MSDKNIVSQSAGKFSEHYEENPLTSLLITTLSVAVPQIAIAKEAIDRAVTKIQQKRFQVLLDELAKGEKLLTPEIIESEEFIHSFVVVYRAAMNTYQRDKVRMFARILLSAVEKDELASDKFEEYVRILEDLSIRELKILELLEKIESFEGRKYTESGKLENDFQKANRYWPQFVGLAKSYIDNEELILDSILASLNRTGLYVTFTGTYYDYEGDRGRTTPLFKEFKDWIVFENDTNEMLYKD